MSKHTPARVKRAKRREIDTRVKACLTRFEDEVAAKVAAWVEREAATFLGTELRPENLGRILVAGIKAGEWRKEGGA